MTKRNSKPANEKNAKKHKLIIVTDENAAEIGEACVKKFAQMTRPEKRRYILKMFDLWDETTGTLSFEKSIVPTLIAAHITPKMVIVLHILLYRNQYIKKNEQGEPNIHWNQSSSGAQINLRAILEATGQPRVAANGGDCWEWLERTSKVKINKGPILKELEVVQPLVGKCKPKALYNIYIERGIQLFLRDPGIREICMKNNPYALYQRFIYALWILDEMDLSDVEQSLTSKHFQKLFNYNNTQKAVKDFYEQGELETQTRHQVLYSDTAPMQTLFEENQASTLINNEYIEQLLRDLQTPPQVPPTPPVEIPQTFSDIDWSSFDSPLDLFPDQIASDEFTF